MSTCTSMSNSCNKLDKYNSDNEVIKTECLQNMVEEKFIVVKNEPNFFETELENNLKEYEINLNNIEDVKVKPCVDIKENLITVKKEEIETIETSFAFKFHSDNNCLNKIEECLEKDLLKIKEEDFKERDKDMIFLNSSSEEKCIEINEKEELFNCRNCSENFSNLYDLKQHLCIHSTKNRSTNSNSLEAPKTKRKHRIKKDPTKHKGFTCLTCGKILSKSTHLKNHEKLHTGERPYACKECGKGFTTKSNLLQHEAIHTGEKPFVCKICEKAFNRPYDLEKHEQIHTVKGSYDCQNCGKNFIRKHNLLQHEKIHTADNPYVCKICEETFINLYDLKKHQQTHADGKPFVCKLCGKSFIINSLLIRHQRFHTGEKPYVCKVCGKSFTRLDSLKIHENMHTGGKPFVCKICKDGFNHPYKLRTHEKTHANKKID